MTLQAVEQLTATGSTGSALSNQAKYVPAGTGPLFFGPGDQIKFLITGEETGGAFFLAEVTVPPGGGVPPHIHRFEDESFRILEGNLTIHVGGKTLDAAPGDLAYLPRNVVHFFQNTGNVDAKFLLYVTPAGLEKFFEEAFTPSVDGSSKRPPVTEAMIARLHEAAVRYGVELLLPPVQ